MVTTANSINTGHTDVIHDAVVDFYGRRLATCSSDESIKIYDIKERGSQTLVAHLKGHEGPVWRIAWAHPLFETLLASCSYDGTVIIWKEDKEWDKYFIYSDHSSSVNSVAWADHKYGLILACCSLDGTISILTHVPEEETFRVRRIMAAHENGCNSVSWCPSPNDDIPDFSHGQSDTSIKRLASGGSDNLIKIWREDGEEWIQETQINAHSDWVCDIAWAPLMGLNKNMIASCSKDRRVIISTTDDFITWKSDVLRVFDDLVWSVSWSATANMLAVSGADDRITLWKMDPEGKWKYMRDVVKRRSGIFNC